MAHQIEKAPGVWLIRVYIGKVGGKRKYASKTFKGTTHQARQEARRMQMEQDEGTIAIDRNTKLSDFLASWLAGKSNIEQSTRESYEHIIRSYVADLGQSTLSSVTPALLRAHYVLLRERKMSPRTIRYAHGILHQAFEVAVEDRLMAFNPCTRKSVREALPKSVKTKDTFLTPEEIPEVLSKEPHPMWRALWAVLLGCALRPQEAISIRWEDISDGYLSIKRARQNLKGGDKVKEGHTKSAAGLRTVAIPEVTLGHLKAWQRESGRIAGYVFEIASSKRGSRLPSTTTIQAHWKAVYHQRLYSARHTLPTHLIDQGESPVAVAALLGHSDPAMTLRRYTHATPEGAKRVAGKMNAMLLAKEA